jgi:hypothetical protein
MQLVGYNNKKLPELKEKREEIVLNIGCLESVKENYVNVDLVPDEGIRTIFKIITGKIKLDYELFVNITFYDKNL